MRRLGERWRNGIASVHIVELSDEELFALEHMLSKEQQTPEATQAWRYAIIDLRLPTAAHNGLLAIFLDSPQLFTDEDGKLYDFGEWGNRVLANFDRYGLTGRFRKPAIYSHRIGEVRYMSIIQALRGQRHLTDSPQDREIQRKLKVAIGEQDREDA